MKIKGTGIVMMASSVSFLPTSVIANRIVPTVMMSERSFVANITGNILDAHQLIASISLRFGVTVK